MVGNKRVIAFYEPDNDHCALNAVVYDKTDADTGMTTAARFRVSLNPREVVHIDSGPNGPRFWVNSTSRAHSHHCLMGLT